LVKEEQKNGRDSDSYGDLPGGAVVENTEGASDEEDGEGEERQMTESKASGGVGWVIGVSGRAFGIVFPGVDEETVEATQGRKEKCRGEQREPKSGLACDGGDEDGSGEEDADGNLFGEAMGAVGGVDQYEISEQKTAENEVKMYGLSGEPEQERSKGGRGQQNSCEEGAAVSMVEVMARFEMMFLRSSIVERTSIQQAGIKKTVGGVEHPDRDEHGDNGREGKVDVIGGGDEPDPKRGYRWGIEGE
jgi:hypothetical protein